MIRRILCELEGCCMSQKQFKDLLARINEVLGNEIQANHVDDTKIQGALK